MPAVRLARFALAVRVPGAVDPEAVRISHPAVLPALQFIVPPPVLVMLTVWAEGFAPPCTPVKLRLVGLRPIVETGGEGVCARMPATSGRCVSFRGVLELEDDPDGATAEIGPADDRGARFAEAEGRGDWEDGTTVGTVTLPIAGADRAVVLDFVEVAAEDAPGIGAVRLLTEFVV